MPPPRSDEESSSNIEPTNRNSSSNGTDDEKFHDGRRASTSAALLRNPLANMTREEILADVDTFVKEKGLGEHCEDFRKGALIAQVSNKKGGFESIDLLSQEEKQVLRKEETSRWHQPFMLYFLCTLCAGSAIVQGMDQTAVNGAQEFYYEEFDITNLWMRGLLNGAPYLCSALVGCWTNPILNKWLGRRGTIFVSCFVSVVTGFWMAVCKSWGNLLAARFMLGFAVGAKSSTTPVYSAESTPKNIRGALTMMWQMWTAFGIALGFIVSVAFQHTDFLGQNSQWRWMLASTSIPPLIVMLQVYLCPESPRWYMEKGRYGKAYQSVTRLRHHPIQATRDMYYAYKLLQIEQKEREERNIFKEFFTVRRNRRAAQSAWFCMFMQQFCGVTDCLYTLTTLNFHERERRSEAHHPSSKPFELEMANGSRGRRFPYQHYDLNPYQLPSNSHKDLGNGVPQNNECSKALEKNEWEDASCSVCMEYPHNAVLLLCSSHDKGCRPYMCATSFRYSNCLDQYKKAYTKVTSPKEQQNESVNNSSVGIGSGWPRKKHEQTELACPLCRGQVKGWTVVEPARKYLNAKKRSCVQDDCSFFGTYKKLRKHVKAEHPSARPHKVDPMLEQKWRSFEHERDREDVISTIRSSMPGAVVIGDYVIERNTTGFSTGGINAGNRDGPFDLGLNERFNDLLRRQALGLARNVSNNPRARMRCINPRLRRFERAYRFMFSEAEIDHGTEADSLDVYGHYDDDSNNNAGSLLFEWPRRRWCRQRRHRVSGCIR